jgi:DNA-nicking Smr family endonuclease
MNKSNDVAAVNIFNLNNLDLNNSNTLDLHGLHVNEAFKMFKQVYLKKKEEYRHCNKNNKKQNRYLFVITGWGRHSVNKNARLRPQIMRHLNNNSIKFEEPHIGLIRVDLV